MNRARPEGLTRSPFTHGISRSRPACCDEASHDSLLDDLEHDALVDPDIARIIFRARELLQAPAAEVPWWAR